MAKVYLATRIDREDNDRIENLVKRTKLGRAKVARRLIAIALKHVKEPEDLLRL